MTDELSVYYTMKSHFAEHSTVNHAKKEYARKEENLTVTTNTVESFFALLKRSNCGSQHHMSRKFLASCCAKRDFVYNERRPTDGQRTNRALRSAGEPAHVE